jgi:cold shock CspA family protein
MERGTLVKWNDQRGFGFIRPDLEGPDVFVHVSVFEPLRRRPKVGDAVGFESIEESPEKRKARSASLLGTGKEIRRAAKGDRRPPARRAPRTSESIARGNNTTRRKVGRVVLAAIIPAILLAILLAKWLGR